MSIPTVDQKSLRIDLWNWLRARRRGKVDARRIPTPAEEAFLERVEAAVAEAATSSWVSMASTIHARDSMAQAALAAGKDGSSGRMRARWQKLPELVRRSIVKIEQERAGGVVWLMLPEGRRSTKSFEDVDRYIKEVQAGSVALWLLNACGSPLPKRPRRSRGQGLRTRKAAKAISKPVGKRGRPANSANLRLVQLLADEYHSLTGRMPGRQGPFGHLVAIAYGALPENDGEDIDKVVRRYLTQVKGTAERIDAEREDRERALKGT